MNIPVKRFPRSQFETGWDACIFMLEHYECPFMYHPIDGKYKHLYMDDIIKLSLTEREKDIYEESYTYFLKWQTSDKLMAQMIKIVEEVKEE